MTREEAAKNAEVMLAWSRGEGVLECRVRGSDTWHPVTYAPEFNLFEIGEYRIKPAARLRPWTPEEAIGKAVRHKKESHFHLVVKTHLHGAVLGEDSIYKHVSFSGLLENWMQPDGSPCGTKWRPEKNDAVFTEDLKWQSFGTAKAEVTE